MPRTSRAPARTAAKGSRAPRSPRQFVRSLFGNRTLGRVLAGGRTPDLTSALGGLRGVMDRPGDHAERRAEGMARSGGPEREAGERDTRAVKHRSTRRPDFGVLKDTAFARTLSRGLSGGRTIGADIRRPMERSLETDLGDARLHDGPEAGRIARSLGARAATVGHHIYVDRRQVDPDTAGGRQVMRHELTHVGQNKGSPKAGKAGAAIQRAHTKRRQDGWDTVYDCYSDILGDGKPLKNPRQFGVAYAGASAEAEFGGHAWCAFEYFEQITDPTYGDWMYPNTIWTDLVTDTVRMEKDDEALGHIRYMMADDKYVGTTFYPVSTRSIENAIKQAKSIGARYRGESKPSRKHGKDALYYTRTGVGKNKINCAKYVEDVLRAANIDASAGKIIKTPSKVATGLDHGDFKKKHGKGDKKKAFS